MADAIFRQGQNGYSGTLDTFLRESRADRTYGGEAFIDVDSEDSAGVAIQGLVWFDGIFGAGAGRIPLGARITSATLTLNVSDSTRAPFSTYLMQEDWSARPVWSWNGFGNGVQTNGTEAATTAIATYSGIAKGTQTLDVTSSLQAWSDGAANYGWLFQGGPDGFRFASSESGTAPTLSVTYEIVAPPSAGLVVTETGGDTVVAEGGAGDQIRVALSAAPTSNVTVTLSSSSPSDLALSETSLTFTTSNWQTAQTVAVAAVDDSSVEGTETVTVSLSSQSGDARYAGLSSSVDVLVTDNDVAPPPPPPPGPKPLSPVVVAVHAATAWTQGDASGAGNADPSGIAYIPGLDLLFVADSEHDESPFYSQTNLFAVHRDGTQAGAFSLRAFTDEPTGLAYNPKNGLLYITDDDDDRIYIVDPQNPGTKLGEIDVERLGFEDAEDPVIDPANGHIFLLDGVQRLLVELTATGDLVRQTVLPTQITDAEGLAYDATEQVFYISSGSTRGKIFQTDRDGDILASFDVDAFRNPITSTKPRLKGLELAPSSDPHDGDKLSLYAVDYGLDQQADGRMFEIDLHHDWLGA